MCFAKTFRIGCDGKRVPEWYDISLGVCKDDSTGTKGTVFRVHSLPQSSEGAGLCPVAAAWLVANDNVFDAPHDAFFKVSDSQPLRYAEGVAAVKGWVARLAAKRVKGFVGADPSRYATHSYRSTGATLARLAGYSYQFVRALGRWRSDCYKQYIHLALGTVACVHSHMLSGSRVDRCPMERP